MNFKRFSEMGRRPRLAVEVLEGRDCPAVTASFAGGILTVVGDGMSNQVDVVELGGGVVEVTGDGQKFPFSGVESIVVETLDGDDRVEYGYRSPAAVSEMGDRLLSIDVGAGDDVMILRDPGPDPDLPVPTTLHFAVKLRGGTGSDFLSAEVNHGTYVDLDVFTIDGQDTCGFSVLQYPNRRIVIVPTAIHTTLDLGGGGNIVSLGTGHAEEVEVHVKTSDPAGTTSGSSDRFTLTFGGQTTGPLQPWQLIAKQRTFLDLGGADDRVTMEVGGFGDVSAEIGTGGGNDRVSTYTWSYLLRHPHTPVDPDLTRFAFDARLGDGDDRLDAKFAGYSHGELNLDAGAGNDRVSLTVLLRRLANPQLPPPDQSTFGFNAGLGAGEDRLRLAARGYDEVRANLNTGPADDTNDQVLATFVHPDNAGPRRRNLVTLKSMDVDRVGLVGVGYPIADITLQGHQCLVSLSGGIP